MTNGIRLFRRSGTEWVFIAPYPDWKSLYAANPDAVEGLKGYKDYRTELEKSPQLELPSPAVPEPGPAEPLPEIPESERVYISRQLKDWRIGYVSQDEIDGLHWDTISGGVNVTSPQPFIYGYVACTRVRGEIGHSCIHGEAPHRIKVMLTKSGNSKSVFKWALGIAGPKPARKKR